MAARIGLPPDSSMVATCIGSMRTVVCASPQLLAGHDRALSPDKLRKARAELAKGIGIVKVAKVVGLGVGTMAKLKNEMAANA